MRATAALVLAGGPPRRPGEPYQLLDWHGRPLLGHIVEEVSGWPVRTVTVVLGCAAEEILASLELACVTVVINPEWQEGVASSLRVGLDALSRDPSLEAVVIVPGDQPDIAPAVVEAMLAAVRRDTLVVVPKYRYAWGYPVLVARSLWQRLMSTSGDQDLLTLLKAHAAWVTEVPVDRLPPRSVDSPAGGEDRRPRREGG